MIEGKVKQQTVHWHAVSIEAVFDRLKTNSGGLSEQEAKARLSTYGYNRLKPPKRRSAFRRFLAQFNNLLIYILLVAAGTTFFLGKPQ